MARATTAFSCGSRCWSASAVQVAPRASTASTMASRAFLAGATLAFEARANESKSAVRRELRARRFAALAVFELAGIQAALGHHQAMGDSQQLRIRELDAGTRVAVIVEDLDAGG